MMRGGVRLGDDVSTVVGPCFSVFFEAQFLRLDLSENMILVCRSTLTFDLSVVCAAGSGSYLLLPSPGDMSDVLHGADFGLNGFEIHLL